MEGARLTEDETNVENSADSRKGQSERGLKASARAGDVTGRPEGIRRSNRGRMKVSDELKSTSDAARRGCKVRGGEGGMRGEVVRRQGRQKNMSRVDREMNE